MSLMATIAAEVAARHGLTLADLRSQDCRRWVSRARREAMTLIYATGERSLAQIGRFLNRDHTTVFTAVRRHCAAEGMQPIYRGLRSDPERDLWIVSLRQSGLTYNAIARTLKISRGAVSGVLHRARYTTLSTGPQSPVESAALLNDPAKEGHRIAA